MCISALAYNPWSTRAVLVSGWRGVEDGMRMELEDALLQAFSSRIKIM